MSAYLNEKSVGIFLHQRLENIDVISNKAFSKEFKFRPDFHIPELKLIVEFDGYQHYNSVRAQDNDAYKEGVLISLGYTIIRIPYFIQLDERVVKFLFGCHMTDSSGYNTYPHGFVDPKALLPFDFNYLGMEKFKKDLETFSFLKEEILSTLKSVELKVLALDSLLNTLRD